ncbi:prepilin peptidase [Azospirillum sp. B506]|uniref:A24 family peptidase n=1 Tax=Azospirillum sp. B506 TaxID=137721 RepID=UPI0006792BDC|nr:prepilin peptidase [Azospirillum sp. B506]
MKTLLSGGAAILLVAAAVSDFRTRTIPNWIPAFLGLLFALAAMVDPSAHPPLSSVAGAVLVFIPLLILFARGKMGGGDVKLLTAAALWSGWGQLPALLIVTVLTGGVLAIVALVRVTARRAVDTLALFFPCSATAKARLWLEALLRTRNVDALPLGEAGLPYGIAIAAGGLSVLYPFGSTGM